MNLQIRKDREHLGHTAAVYCLAAFGSDKFLSAGGDGLIVEWQYGQEDGRALARLDEHIFSLIYLADQNCIACGAFSGDLYIVNLDDPDRPRRLQFHQGGIFAIQHIGSYLIVGGGDGKISFYDPSSFDIFESIAVSHESIRDIQYHAPLQQLIISTSDAGIYFMDLKTKSVVDTIAQAHEPSVFSCLWDHTHNRLISGGRDAKLRSWLYRAADWQMELSLDAHWFTINDLCLLPRQGMLATASRDKSIRLWDSKMLSPLLTIDRAQHGGHVNSVNKLLWNEERSLLISAGDDRQIILWHIEQ